MNVQLKLKQDDVMGMWTRPGVCSVLVLDLYMFCKYFVFCPFNVTSESIGS